MKKKAINKIEEKKAEDKNKKKTKITTVKKIDKKNKEMKTNVKKENKEASSIKDAEKHKKLEVEKPDKLKNNEIENLIIKLAKQDIVPEKIGLILRDSYGIPDVKDMIGRSVSQVLKQKDMLKLPSDIMHLIKKLGSLEKHFKENKQDMTAKRSIQITKSKIRKLTKYYISKGVLKKDFRYTEIKI